MIERDKEYYNQKISELYKDIENQEKIIRDLQEENGELSRMCEIYSKSLYNAELTSANERIDKAMEYIEDWLFDAGGNGAEMPYEDIDDLLEILKGDR